LSSKIIRPPQPPGPGLPLQAPSVAASIAILSLFQIFEADIKCIGLKKYSLT